MTEVVLHPARPLASPHRGAMVARAGEAVRHGVEWLDQYTSPRENTHGNLVKPSMFQAAFNGACDGFYIFGPLGIFTGGAAATAGIAVQNKTDSQLAGVAVGVASGALLGAVTAGAVGGPVGIALGAINGALLGAFETMRGHSEACTRDGGNGSMVSAFFLKGPVKMAGGLASMIGASCESNVAKAVVGGGVGAALAAALTASGASPIGMTTAVVVSAAAGAIGPFFGRRFSQLFRNLGEDLGTGIVKAARKTGVVRGPVADRTRLMLGAIPASYAKEALRGFLYSDGSITALIAGGVKESVRQVHILWRSRSGDGPAATTHENAVNAGTPSPASRPSSS